MIKLVAFDWNGTLLADSNACAYAINRVLERFGGDAVTLEECRDSVLLPAADFYAAHGCDRDALMRDTGRAGEIFHESYERRAEKARSRKGAKGVLKWLRGNCIGSVVLSSHITSRIECQFRRLGMDEYISAVLANAGRDSFLKPSRKRQLLEGYLGANGLEKSEVMTVDDSPEGAVIAKGAGIRNAAITGGFYSETRLKKGSPDYIIGSLCELKGIIGEINGL